MATPVVSRLKGTGYNQVQFPTKSPEQMDIFRQLLSGSGGNIQSILEQLKGLSGGGGEEYWNKLEAPALRQFERLQGGIASRFSGMGTGARKSSAFQNQNQDASTDLAERLQAQRLGLQDSARSQLMNLYGSLMGQNVMPQTAFMPKQQSFWKQLLGSLAPGVGQAAGQFGSMGFLG